jgi:hypothetical protein
MSGNKPTQQQRNVLFKTINARPNAMLVYGNKNWKYVYLGLGHGTLMFSNTRKGDMFYITKNGSHQPHYKPYFFGPGNTNYHRASEVKEAINNYNYRIPRPSNANVAGYKARMAKKPAENKKKANNKARINSIIANAKAGGSNYKKASLDNIAKIVMSSNSSTFRMKNGKCVNIFGKVATRKALLNEFEIMKTQNFRY